MKRTWEISRRSALKGLGTTLALPWLEAMSSPAASASGVATSQSAPLRMAFFYVPNGVHIPAWMPEAVGSSFELPATLSSRPTEGSTPSLTVRERDVLVALCRPQAYAA